MVSRLSLIRVLALMLLASGVASAQSIASARIQPWPDNPRYWAYKGKPIVLLGGSKEDNLFQIPDLAEHLDILADAGGNYVRNTMSSRDEGNVWPFQKREDGKYDLEQLNDEYFDRLESLLQLARDRDIIVQIELWDRFDFAMKYWQANPFRPANNVNYTPEASRLKNDYPDHPGNNANPFFRTVPSLENNETVLKYQRAQVDRMLSVSLRFPNVLYCMDNETSGKPEWGAYWSEYIKKKAAELSVDVYTTEMWDAWDLKDPIHRHTLDHPETYAFADISQNNHNKGQAHWDNLAWVRERIASHPRPLNCVKIYGADTGKFGTGQDGLERFWRGLIGGAAGVRFHRPDSGLGLNELAQANIRSARMLADVFEFPRATPDAASKLLLQREPNEAYVSRVDTDQYVVYFPKEGSVQLDLSGHGDSLSLRWLDILHNEWGDWQDIGNKSVIELKPPANGMWIALIAKP
ncbi:MAG: hypothetical protein K1Y02_15135 [Candidatus Hydrogenedentes bacterium]|nr:hypothetical protein [Candidatus Hydrogenedentota bacterium]